MGIFRKNGKTIEISVDYIYGDEIVYFKSLCIKLRTRSKSSSESFSIPLRYADRI